MSTRRRWTTDTITSELRTLIATHGHWPTQRELQERGLSAMVKAMRRIGDRSHWETLLADTPATPDRPAPQPPGPFAVAETTAPPHDHIAQAAYFLYRNGHPGDHLVHWATAERQLRAAA